MNRAPTASSPGLTQACQQIVHAIHQHLTTHPPPLLVALDGGSGAGKSALAAMLAEELDATWIPLDDFFSAHIPEAEWDAMPIPQRAQAVFDWPRLRAHALESLLSGRDARWDTVEAHYFTVIRPPSSFDLIVTPR